MAQTIKLAVIPGDGIGPEVIDQAVRVLDAVARALESRSTRHISYSVPSATLPRVMS